MARYFAVLLVICLAVGSGTTTTKPQVQQKTEASKDLCKVSTIAQHFTQLIAHNMGDNLEEDLFSDSRQIFAGSMKTLAKIRTRRFEKFTLNVKKIL